jgi:hypothetical protein
MWVYQKKIETNEVIREKKTTKNQQASIIINMIN